MLGAKTEEKKKPFDDTIEPCEPFRRGKCTSGHSCLQSHDVEILNIRRRKLCVNLLRHGYCRAGDTCKWSHNFGAYPCFSKAAFGTCKKKACNYSHEAAIGRVASSSANGNTMSSVLLSPQRGTQSIAQSGGSLFTK
uniref:C3H1-type domain-containing protein n=1 Tax=Chromera velia CCMP2878 TaxID=1169474 RepID=A0A0G4HV45_9ALVE|mmetsp:Transcript_14925/g.30146  ORF Transcript_14925/g.30146 Transcript_14925/m.30146 type:complete len:137 (-) Transcript_14925:1544-1954(-)|eukprot:Cvel_8737.t1-p1 / transcript=Cvel_8737.t1 / gene=Cvel_8737 / organism=Chromera_velia_CCMP2878 / gene_product=Zinc finger CCCH domain-containing protein 7, putative / transcript_product=Zinc finger CCCH domain-containing protein 7, putative / location=Cvel_scaffold488:82227-83119(-) / protein_length=136 / sequence_SO=supercontig / SO=protein_coding / is_pseudo=false